MIEGYTESLDHEIRDHGIGALIIEPAYTRTGFEADSAKPDTPLHAYAQQRQTADRARAEAVRGGDAPAVVEPGDRHGAHRPEAEAALHRRPPGPAAHAYCAASPPPGTSTSRSEDEATGRLTCRRRMGFPNRRPTSTRQRTP